MSAGAETQVENDTSVIVFGLEMPGSRTPLRSPLMTLSWLRRQRT